MQRNYRLASALMRDSYLITAQAAEAHLPLLQSWLDDAQLHRDEDDGAEEAKALDPMFGCYAVMLGDSGTQQVFKTFDEAPSGSTALLSIEGVVMKDDFCDVGMNTKAEQIRTAYQHPNIGSILIEFDTPGGASNAPALVADAIREAIAAGVPVLGWVNHGMVMSAGYWIAAACCELWLSQPSDQVGGIGAYQRIRKAGDSGTLEVYAPQSTQKNLPQRQAAAGDTKLLEAELGELVDVFHLSVQADRPGLAADSPVFQGGMFMGQKAVAAGLADGICTRAAAIERVQQLAREASAGDGGAGLGEPTPAAVPPLLLNVTPLTHSTTVETPLLAALFGAALAFDKDKGTYLNAAQLTQVEQHLATAAANTAALGTARTDLAKANEKLATYANVPATEHGAPKQDGQDRQPTPEAAAEVDPWLTQVLTYKKELGIPNGTPAK